MLNEQFKPFKPERTNRLPSDIENKVFQLKVDGGNIVIDVDKNYSTVSIFHARDDTWRNRTYRYPEVVKEIRQGKVLRDDATYIAEGTVLDELGVGRKNLHGKRQLENNFQINRCSKLIPFIIYPHHVVRDGQDTLFDVPYSEQLKMLSKFVKKGNHIHHIPTFNTPEPLLKLHEDIKKKNGLGIEGIIVKELDSLYHIGKRGQGQYKKKFLKEKTVKCIGYEVQNKGILLVTDRQEDIHYAGSDYELAMNEIDEHSMVMIEIEFLEHTFKGYRDCSVKRIIPMGSKAEIMEI